MIIRFFLLCIGYALISCLFIGLLEFGFVKSAILGIPALLLIRLVLRWRPGRGYIFRHSRSDNTVRAGIITQGRITRQESPIRFLIIFILELAIIIFFSTILIMKAKPSEFPALDRFIECEIGNGIHEICFL